MNGIPEPKVRPIILAVDDERKDLELVERELRKRYEAAYHVACEARSGPDSSGRGVSRRPGKTSPWCSRAAESRASESPG